MSRVAAGHFVRADAARISAKQLGDQRLDRVQRAGERDQRGKAGIAVRGDQQSRAGSPAAGLESPAAKQLSCS